jgi:hypothetical protein
MTKPEDISDDVWEAAEKIWFRVSIDIQAEQFWDIRPTIARAILAERERTAGALKAAEDEIARCHARLEIDHYFKMGDNDDSDLERVDIPMDERASFPDAVAARDATIQLLEDQLAAIRNPR